MPSSHGHVNGVFSSDVDIIEPATVSTSSQESSSLQSGLADSRASFFCDRPDCFNEEGVGPSNIVRRWSQNLTKFSKGKKDSYHKTLNKLPSRKIFAIDGKLLSLNNADINQFASEIEQHEHLMEDNATSEIMRNDTIKALPHSLTTKRKIKEKLAITVTQHSSDHVNQFFSHLKFRVIIFLIRLRNAIQNNVYSIELCYASMKQIEGHFGSSVGTYFKFLRWLFTLNFFLFIFTFGFITLPQILYDSLGNEQYDSRNETGNSLKWMDFLTAEGYFTKSVIFYGAYTNTTFSLSPPYKYSIPHAYFMTMLALYITIFIIISSSMARSYRKSFIETSGGLRTMYAHKIFCSWDFGISNKEAAHLKHASIYNELKEVLNETKADPETIPKLQKCWIIASQVTAHFLVFALLGGLGAGMWTLLQIYGDENESSPWTTLYLSIAVNLTITVLPTLFSWISIMEDYNSPRRTLHITLLRNFMLEAVIIGVLVVFWLTRSFAGCRETSIGQEIYRLVIVDFLITILASSVIQFLRVFVCKKIWPSIEKQEFDISRKSLGLVFNQTLLWVGLLYAPALAGIVTVKMALTFYIKKYTLIYLCKPPSKVWRSAQTQTLYLVITFLSLLGVIVAHGYIMTQVPVSTKCGPFRGNNYMFQIFIEGVLALRENHWIWRAVMTITRPAVMGGILLTMVVVVYYLRSKSQARIAMVKLLKDMLFLEAKDKEFLLLNIAKVTEDRDYLFDDDNVKDVLLNGDIHAESSNTWRYKSGLQTESNAKQRSRRI